MLITPNRGEKRFEAKNTHKKVDTVIIGAGFKKQKN